MKKLSKNIEKKILLVCDYFWPSVGGVEVYIEDLGIELQKQGYSVEIACRALRNRNSNQYSGMIIHEFSIENGTIENNVKLEIDRFRNLIQKSDYISIISLSQPDNWIGIGLNNLPNPHPKIIMLPSISASNAAEWAQNHLGPSIISLLKSINHIVTVSENGYDNSFTLNAGVITTYIPHSIEKDAVSIDFRREYGFDKNAVLFVMVANFWPVKNHDGLIEVLSKYKGNWQLAIIGNKIDIQEDYYQKIVTLAKSFNQIKILGGLPRPITSAAIRDADLLLVPSKAESAGPLVVLQSMSYGTPWIATPDCNSVKDEAGGIIAPIEQFPKAIDFILSEKEIRNKLSFLGKEHWQNSFRWKSSIPMYLALIEGLKLPYSLKMPENLREQTRQIQNEFIKYFNHDEQLFDFLFSVVIPTFNRSQTLKKCLEALAIQNFPSDKFEVIVCDDGSTDNTANIVKSMNVSFSLNYFYQTNKGPAAARNMGIRQSKGKFLLILNDDAILESNALSIHFDLQMKHLGEKISVLGNFKWLPQYTQSCIGQLASKTDIIFEYPQMVSGLLYDYNHFYTCNISISKKAVDEVGLFDENFNGPAAEDIEFGFRLEQAGYRVLFESSCIAWHDHSISLETFCKVHEVRGHGSVILSFNQPKAFSLDHVSKNLVEQWQREITESKDQIEKLIDSLKIIGIEKRTKLTKSISVDFFKHLKLLQRYYIQKGMLSNPLLDKIILRNIENNLRKNSYLVSVIIPCYNYANYLLEAVESIIDQSYKNYEIIIVNDGSTDNTKEVAEKIIKQYSNYSIRLINQMNSGHPSHSRNAGIKNSNGDYIVCLDADDKFGETYLEECVNTLKENNEISIAYSDQIYIEGKIQKEVKVWDYDFKKLLASNYFGYSAMYKRKVWDDVGGYKPVGYEDWDFWISAGAKGHFAKRISKPLFYYRVNENGEYRKDQVNDIINKAKIVVNHKELYNQKSVNDALTIISKSTNENATKYSHRVNELNDYKLENNNYINITAIISAYNEADVISHVIKDLVEQNINVYLIDHHSTDNTIKEASKWLGNGLLKIESFPEDAGLDIPKDIYSWRYILIRKEQIVKELGEGWYIHADADEFRESPWKLLNLRQGIERVDSEGYNAINFKIYDFKPVDNKFQSGSDVRQYLKYYSAPRLDFDNVQVKCWRYIGNEFNIWKSGGHVVEFSDRRIYPIPFILRHYPIRSQAHGETKIFNERINRFDVEEKKASWHAQYDHIQKRDYKFIRPKSELKLFDRETICNDLLQFYGTNKESSLPVVSIIALSYNQLEYTKSFIESVKNNTETSNELILIDNASNQETVDYLKPLSLKDNKIKIIFNHDNLGFPKGVNQAINISTAKYVLIANNDIIVTKGWLKRLINIAESNNNIGIIAPISNYVSGVQLDKNAKYKSIPQMHKYAAKIAKDNAGQTLEFPRVAFLCTLIKKEVIDKIGGLDERFSPGNFEDDDFCLRAQMAGYKTVIAKDVFIHHYGSKSFTADGKDKYLERLEINKQIFVQKWGADPEEIWLQNKPIKKRNPLYPIDPDLFIQYFRRALIQIEEKEFDLAIKSLEDSISNFHSSERKGINVEYTYVLDLAANISLILKENEKAKNYFEEELKLSPSSSRACLGLGSMFLDSQNYEKAKSMFEWAVKNDPLNQKAIEFLRNANKILGHEQDNNSLLEKNTKIYELNSETPANDNKLLKDNDMNINSRNDLGYLFNSLDLLGHGVEIGVQAGEFSKTIRTSWKGKFLHLVDRWKYNPNYNDIANLSDEEQKKLYLKVVELFADDPSVMIHRMDSLVASQSFPDNYFDWIYIDADHSYAGCKSDLNAWYPKLKPGGIFAGHDFLDGNYTAGEFGVKSAVEEFIKDKNVQLNLTYVDYVNSWYFQKSSSEVSNNFPKPLNFEKNNPNQLIEEAREFQEKKEFKRALSKLTMAEAMFNGHLSEPQNSSFASAFFSLKGYNYLGDRDLDKAKECFEKALTLNPNSSEACSGLGDLFLLNGDNENAKIMYEWAVKNNPYNDYPKEALEKLNFNPNLIKNIVPNINDGKSESAKVREVLEKILSSVFELFNLKEYDEALFALNKNEQLFYSQFREGGNNDIVSAYENMKGFVYLALDQVDNAHASFETGLNLNPNSSQACAGIGEVFYLRSEDENAKSMFELSLKLDPNNLFAQAGMKKVNDLIKYENEQVSIIEETKNEEQILETLEKILSVTYEIFNLKKFDEALYALKQYQELFYSQYREGENNDIISAYENLKGFVYLGQNDNENAKKAFETALNLNPSSSQACAGLGEVLFLNQEDEKAKSMFEWSLKNDPGNLFAQAELRKVNELLMNLSGQSDPLLK